MDNSGNNGKINGNIFGGSNNFSPVNPFNQNYTQSDSSNPFEIHQPPQQDTTASSNPIKRLNGYDSNILNSTKFDNQGEEVSIEYRIKDKESTIRDLDAKIKLADNYGTQNEALGLRAKKRRLLQELDSLRKQQIYGGRVLGEKNVSSHKTLKETMPVVYQIQDFISRQIMAKISKKVNSVVTLSDSLDKLAKISKSVDELIDMNVPYGEKTQNYEKLTDYLNQANLIHSKITKTIGRK